MLNNTQAHNDMWQYCLDRIKAQTSAEEFEKWFQPIVPLEFDGTTLRLRVPNESYVRQIEKNYIPFLRPIISRSTDSRRNSTTPCPAPRPQQPHRLPPRPTRRRSPVSTPRRTPQI